MPLAAEKLSAWESWVEEWKGARKAAFDDMNGDPVGMQHGLRLSSNGPVEPPLDSRPWVTTLEIDYCLGQNAMDCPEDQISANANGFYVFSTIMVPQP